MNFWLFTPSFFPLLHSELQDFSAQFADDAKAEFLLPDIVGRLLQRGEVTTACLPHDDTWFGMTHREDREGAVSIISKMLGQAPYTRRSA